MISEKVVVFVVLLGVALAYGPGQYVPKSFYIIDHFGHQSEPVYIRNRREIMDQPLFRVRRGGGYASSSSHASASAGSSAGGSSGGSGGGGAPIYYGDYVPSIAHDPSGILNQVQNLINNIPGASGAGAHSFASSSSSASAGNGAGGPSSGQSYGGLGSGHDAGYKGPVLFSRFGEAEGTGVQVSGQAQGNRGAFASTSSQVDDKGKIHYSVQSGKY